MKILAKVKYLGTNYHGWQKQVNDNSVQTEIEKVLSQILNEDISIVGSGRTDAGVHALGQTFHFVINKDIDLDRFRYSVNSLLPHDIHIISFERVDEDFHARFNVKKKHYRYHFYSGELDPFLEGRATFYPQEFDRQKLKNSLSLFVGKHNYQDFTSKEEDELNFIREIYEINYVEEGNNHYIDFIGNGFMRYMIRDIVGTVLAVASNKIDISFISNHLDSKKREIVSYKAPSDGLYLIDVIY